jgi:hypothetical protein
MTPCKFTFDDSPAFDGFAHGSKWNGFDNVAVKPGELQKIALYFVSQRDPETAEELLLIEPMSNGLISLGWGFCTQIDYSDVLAALAAADGAILYWQTDKARFKPALDAGVIRQDGELLVHPDAITIEWGVAYAMPPQAKGTANIKMDDVGRASQLGDEDAAFAMLQEIAGITDGGVASLVLSGFDWSKADQWARVQKIAEWIRAEKNYEK